MGIYSYSYEYINFFLNAYVVVGSDMSKICRVCHQAGNPGVDDAN